MIRYALVLLVLFSLKTEAQIQIHQKNIYKDIFWSLSSGEIVFGNDSLRLIFDVTDGNWTGLYYPGVSANILRVKTVPDVMVDGEWMLAQPHPESLQDFIIFIDPYRKNVSLNLTWVLADTYEFTAHYALSPKSAIIERSASLKKNTNSGYDAKVGGFRFELPHILAGSSTDCTISVPGLLPDPKTFLPPSTPYDSLTSTHIQFPSTPDAGFGLIIMENKKLSTSIAAWMKTQGETNCVSYIKGNGASILFSHDNRRSYQLSNAVTVRSDKQVIHVSHDPQQIYNHYRDNFGYPHPSPKERQEEDMVILRVSPAHFKGGMKQITASLTQYKETGFNTISLMPHWKGTFSPVNPVEVDPAIVSKDELQNLVKAAHSLGFRVLFTLVVRGFDVESPLITERPGMFYRNPNGTQAVHGPSKSFLVDWSSTQYQQYLVDLALHDLRSYDIDGYQISGSAYKGPNWNALENPPYYSGSAVVEVIEKITGIMLKEKNDAVFLNESPGPIFHQSPMLSKDNGIVSTQTLLDKIVTGKYTAEHYKQHLLQIYNLLPRSSNRVFSSRLYDAKVDPKRTPVFFCMEALHAFFGIPEVLHDTGPTTAETQQLYDRYKKIFAFRSKYPELRAGDIVLNKVRASDQNVFSGVRRSAKYTTLILVNLSPQVTPVELEIAPDVVGINSSVRLYDIFDSTEKKTPIIKSKVVTTLSPFQVLVGRLTID